MMIACYDVRYCVKKKVRGEANEPSNETRHFYFSF